MNTRRLIYFLFVSTILLNFLSCSNQEDVHSVFLNNYQAFCGYSYSGHTSYIDLGDNHELDGANLTMILKECDVEEVRIPFIVNDDSSRTWIVQLTDNGLHLSHDHRYPDGTEYDQNFYGGYADDEGTELLQYFPADERTIEERPQREINRWAKEFDLENERYYYRLYLRDELRFEAVFDLSEPVQIGR